jgi:hypothetical protein
MNPYEVFAWWAAYWAYWAAAPAAKTVIETAKILRFPAKHK